jgi:hypothetical protein
MAWGLWFLAAGTPLAEAQKSKPAPRESKARSAVTAKAEPSAAPGSRSRGRLPMFYSQLELDDEQRSKVHQIQERYQADVQNLQKQMEDARAERDKQLSALLSKGQQKKLDELSAAFQAARRRSVAPRRSSGESAAVREGPEASRRATE